MTTHKNSPGYRWASRNLLPATGAQLAWTFQNKLERSQWLGTEKQRALQFGQLSAVLAHAKANVPHYQESLRHVDVVKPLTEDIWRQVPIVTRAILQGGEDRFNTANYPSSHGKVTKTSSSGSTARPVSVLHTDISVNWHRALTLRSLLWALDRFDRKLGVIRRYKAGPQASSEGFTSDRWADEFTMPFATGPVAGLNVATVVHKQVDWILHHRPQVLLTFPSNLAALCQFALENSIGLPRMRKIITLGEALPEGVRGLAKRAFGATVADTYSAAELGEIAIQCPDTDSYHVQSESVLVEVLDGDGLPCAPGETGSVVVTSLHNYATPLVRYEIGDLAAVGKPCRCGRGLDVLTAVLGRHRNMMVAPDGSQFWPSFGLKGYHKIAPVSQGQFIQHSASELEVKLVSPVPLSASQEAGIRDIILRQLPVPIGIRFTYSSRINRGESGKFEEFISHVATSQRPVRKENEARNGSVKKKRGNKGL